VRPATNRVKAALKSLMAAIDRATAAQREVEAARAALDRAAARSQLRVMRAEDREGARRAD
jgi:hypothetical protein